MNPLFHPILQRFIFHIYQAAVHRLETLQYSHPANSFQEKNLCRAAAIKLILFLRIFLRYFNAVYLRFEIIFIG
jgi:hypothetical protein